MRSKRRDASRDQDGRPDCPPDLLRPHRPPLRATVRSGRASDLNALLALESKVFATDRMSRRSARQFLLSPRATVLVAEVGHDLCGAAVVLFRHASDIARLYSIAVDPAVAANGIGRTLLSAAEETATARDCQYLRLEVHANNTRAIDCYRKAGYREFGRHKKYYQENGDALRFEKRLAVPVASLADAPPYFHQTTEFTCGPACILMALAWADPAFSPTPATEFRLWREATTIFMSSGPGGCGPFGMAVTLQKHGLDPEIFVTHPGPYFLDTVQSLEKRRVVRITQEDFTREAEALDIRTHVAHADESVLMPALRQGAAAIVLLSGYHMKPKGQPHWVFVFGCEDRFVLTHDPGANRDKQGQAIAPETYAVPWSAFMRMTRCGRDRLGAAILIRKRLRP
jgi:ribosomal protein S18 acetylase RimI-like enzyme